MNKFLTLSSSLLVIILASCTDELVQFNKGEEFVMNNKLNSALHSFYNVTVSNAHDTVKGKAYIYIGYIYHKNHHLRVALENYDLAVDYLMEYPRLLSMPVSNMGKIYTELEDWEPAELYTKKAIELAAGDRYLASLAHLRLGVAYQESGRLDAAMYEYKKAMWEPDLIPDVLNNIGNLYLFQKNYDSALHYLDQALAAGFEDTPLVAFNKARLYLETDQLSLASQYAYQSLEDNNDMLLDSYGLIDEINKLTGRVDHIASTAYIDLLRRDAKNMIYYTKMASFYQFETTRLKMEIGHKQKMIRWLLLSAALLVVVLSAILILYHNSNLSVHSLSKLINKSRMP